MSAANTRVAARPLSDGRSIKWTLEQVSGGEVNRARVDWLRFTVPLASVCEPERLPELAAEFLDSVGRESRELLLSVRDSATRIAGAMWVCRHVAGMLGERFGFDVARPEDKGRDFYEARAGLSYEGATVGEVLAGAKSHAQASTVHVNLFGSACLHISHEKWTALAAWIDSCGGWITRVDLAVDIFEGYSVEDARSAYLAGEFDVRGKRPSQTEHGSWTSGHSRTWQVGKRDTGKVCRVYEKGDEQFGPEANDPWVRVECEFRNQGRVVDTDVLCRPGDYFAGAYPYCERICASLALGAAARRIPTARQLLDKCANAATAKCYRWLSHTAAPALCAVFAAGGDLLERLIVEHSWRSPARLAGFARETVQRGFDQVAGGLAPPPAPFASGA